MLLRFHLTLQQTIAIDAPQREPVDVGELARGFGLLGELFGLHVDGVVFDGEYGLRWFALPKSKALVDLQPDLSMQWCADCHICIPLEANETA